MQKKTAKPPKYAIALHYLYNRSLVTLEALQLYGETCLNSTISDLTHDHGMKFERRPERHQHQHGGYTYFTRYSLKEDSRTAAKRLLASFELNTDEEH
jgi:hypothetical protein